MSLVWILGLLSSLAGCAPAAPPAPSAPPRSPSSMDTTAAPPSLTEPATATDPCAEEQTTLAIETCVSEHVQRVEVDIRAAVTRFTSVLHARGVPNAATVVAASQADWERSNP